MKKNIVYIVMFVMLFDAVNAQNNPSKNTVSPLDSQSLTGAGQPKEPVGGQPPLGAKPSLKNFDYQVKYQRAFEAVLWSLPALAIYRFRSAAFETMDFKDNDIISYSHTATPKLEAITANSSTPYIASYTDLQKGPVVLEVPAAGADGTLYGQVVDAWQFTIADIGPSGLDSGKGGKFLFTPPGYKGDIPAGYIHVASPNYRIAFALRSIVGQGKTTEDAFHYAQKLRVYYLSEAANPPKQRFIDPSEQRYPTLTFYDDRTFKDIYEIFTVEPSRDIDKVMMGMLTSLGIEKGKPYTPDETTKKAMRQAAIDVWYYLQNQLDNLPKEELYWQDRHYASILMTDSNKTFTWEYDDKIDTKTRALEYFWCTYMPKVLSDSPSTQYLMAMADNKGELLKAGSTYKITIPAKMPVKQFWALTIYDRATFSFIDTPSARTTLSSYDLTTMKKNTDGSVTIYVGPSAPKGLESNWIPTRGKRPLPALRFYGPTDELNNKSFKMPDFELLK